MIGRGYCWYWYIIYHCRYFHGSVSGNFLIYFSFTVQGWLIPITGLIFTPTPRVMLEVSTIELLSSRCLHYVTMDFELYIFNTQYSMMASHLMLEESRAHYCFEPADIYYRTDIRSVGIPRTIFTGYRLRWHDKGLSPFSRDGIVTPPIRWRVTFIDF